MTASGFELAFGTNHVGPFLLTSLLLDRLRESAPARIVNVASGAHYGATGIDFEAVRKPTRTVTGMREYSVSKLANVLHAQELARRLDTHRGHDLLAASRRDRLGHLAPRAVAGARGDEAADGLARTGGQDLGVLRHRPPSSPIRPGSTTTSARPSSPATRSLLASPASCGSEARTGSRPAERLTGWPRPPNRARREGRARRPGPHGGTPDQGASRFSVLVPSSTK